MSSNQLKRKVGGVSVNPLKTSAGDSIVEPPRIKAVGELLEEAGLAYKKEEKEYAELKETLEVMKKNHEETKLELQNLKTWKEDIRKFLTAPHQVPFNSCVGGMVPTSGLAPVQVYCEYTPPLILTEAFPALGELLESQSHVQTSRSIAGTNTTTTTAAYQLPQVVNTASTGFKELVCEGRVALGQAFMTGRAGPGSPMHFNLIPLNENNSVSKEVKE